MQKPLGERFYMISVIWFIVRDWYGLLHISYKPIICIILHILPDDMIFERFSIHLSDEL